MFAVEGHETSNVLDRGGAFKVLVVGPGRTDYGRLVGVRCCWSKCSKMNRGSRILPEPPCDGVRSAISHMTVDRVRRELSAYIIMHRDGLEMPTWGLEGELEQYDNVMMGGKPE